MDVICENCGSKRFQVVGYIQTIQDVKLVVSDGAEVSLADAEDWPNLSAGFQDVLEDHDEYYIECASCLTVIEPVNYKTRITPKTALGRIQTILSGKEWSSDDLETVASIMESAGYDIEEAS